MRMYSYLRELWKKPQVNIGRERWKAFLISLRTEPLTIKIDKPTRLDRARALGYKAKAGIIVVRARVKKGMRKRHEIRSGRRPKRSGMTQFTPAKSQQRISEERVARDYPNMEVLNSYWVADDSKHIWYEVILVDPAAPTIRADKDLNWICYNKHTNRAARGLVHRTRKVY